MKLLLVLLFFPFVMLGMAKSIDPPDDLYSLSIFVAAHLILIGLLALAVRRARAKTPERFLGCSPAVWIMTSVASYIVGMVIPVIA